MDNEKRQIFVVDPGPVPWPVIVVGVPMAGGAFGDFEFIAHVKLLSDAEHREILKGAGEDNDLNAVLEENARLLPQLIVGWDRVKDAGENDVPFSAQKLAEQLKGPFGRQLGAGLWNAVNEVRWGVRLGNFAPPPATGSNDAVSAAPTSSTQT